MDENKEKIHFQFLDDLKESILNNMAAEISRKGIADLREVQSLNDSVLEPALQEVLAKIDLTYKEDFQELLRVINDPDLLKRYSKPLRNKRDFKEEISQILLKRIKDPNLLNRHSQIPSLKEDKIKDALNQITSIDFWNRYNGNKESVYYPMRNLLFFLADSLGSQKFYNYVMDNLHLENNQDDIDLWLIYFLFSVLNNIYLKGSLKNEKEYSDKITPSLIFLWNLHVQIFIEKLRDDPDYTLISDKAISLIKFLVSAIRVIDHFILTYDPIMLKRARSLMSVKDYKKSSKGRLTLYYDEMTELGDKLWREGSNLSWNKMVDHLVKEFKIKYPEVQINEDSFEDTLGKRLRPVAKARRKSFPPGRPKKIR
ncbi:MAG: hypothetical protein ABSE95_16245 [Thermodesulfobacteriota bacterium]|jgi:hypothetical protein